LCVCLYFYCVKVQALVMILSTKHYQTTEKNVMPLCRIVLLYSWLSIVVRHPTTDHVSVGKTGMV